MRLAHLSDIHYLAPMRVPAWRFFNKRLTGWANLKFLRSFQHDSGMIDHLIAALGDAQVDHLAVTGDLTNLALGIEFAALRGLLERTGLGPESISVVPGNHDRYTGGSHRENRVVAYLSPYMHGEGGPAFPYVRHVGGVVLIGIDTACSRPPFMAGGRLGTDQFVRLRHALGKDSESFPVVLLHHPPYRQTRGPLVQWMNGLADYPRLWKALDGRSALVLHGHLHRNLYLSLHQDDVEWRVVGVSSATRHGRLGPHKRSTFHVFELDASGISRIERYTLDEEGPGYVVEDVPESDFTPLVTA